MMMVENQESLVMDAETDEETFMKSPVGMEKIDPGPSSENCYQLGKGIYFFNRCLTYPTLLSASW